MESSSVGERRFLWLSWGRSPAFLLLLLLGCPMMLVSLAAPSVGGGLFVFAVGALLAGVGGHAWFGTGRGLNHFIVVSPEILWFGARTWQTSHRPDDIRSLRATSFKGRLRLEIVERDGSEPRTWDLVMMDDRQRARFVAALVDVLGPRAHVAEVRVPVFPAAV